MDLYLLKKGGVPLFGREWLRSIQLNWQSMATMDPNLERASCSVQDKLDTVFEEGIGILSKVDWSDWATPIVPIVKKSGDVPISGDFKVTINPVLQVDQYLLPRIEDIFASFSGGQRFSKIDLAQAYFTNGNGTLFEEVPHHKHE